MKGYSSAQEVKWLKEAWQRGMDLRMQTGLPVGSHIPRSHRRIRNEVTGQDERLEVNEDLLPLFRDLATLILEGVAWNRMEKELYVRYGYVDDNGKPYSQNSMWYFVMNPMFWGHNSRNYSDKKRGAWIYDESAPMPEGVKIERNVLPAVWDEQTAAKVRAELNRRVDLRGRAKPSSTYRFSRLCVCGACGSLLVNHSYAGKTRRYLKCATRFNYHNLRKPMTCRQISIRREKVQDAFTQILEKRLQGETHDLFRHASNTFDAVAQISEVEKNIQMVEVQIDTLINEQSVAPESVRARYRDRIAELGERLDILKANRLRLVSQSKEQVKHVEEEEMAMEEIRQLGIEAMWTLPDRKINQLLRSILGRYKLVVLDGRVVGVTIR
jgi:hypothetical protein